MTPPTPSFILNRQVELLYRNLRLGQIASIVNASLLVWIAQGTIATTPLVVWWIAALLIAGVRVLQAVRYQASDPALRESSAAGWRQRALLGAASAGLLWAAGALLFMSPGDTTLQLFTGFVMAGMVAGAVPVLAADRLIFRLYAWPVVIAVLVGAYGTDPLHIGFSIMSLLFLLIATRSADYFNDALQETLRLEHEKDGLLKNLDDARQHAERSNRAKTEFLANISHELRTPMNGILGLSELLSQEDLTADQQELLTPLRHSASDLMHKIENLIELSALEAGHCQPNTGPFAVNEMLEGILHRYRQALEAKGLRLVEQVEGDLPPILIGDLDRLRKIIGHLMDNAIKFVDHGEIGITLRLVENREQQVHLEFSITDEGPGIPPEKLAELDGLMIQADGSAVRRHGGIGVGLAIVRRLVTLLDGQFQIESQPGSGTTFRFTLPFERAGD
ncbi:sensor histidine kinase KdpD [Azonexus sp.]|uniref:sensor histidine kinase n=1 Tax=Azonexus sp. TaxID=1872668 RepID=UPI0027B8A3D3|nr:ATP-binding protein [Azonexus sp.]